MSVPILNASATPLAKEASAASDLDSEATPATPVPSDFPMIQTNKVNKTNTIELAAIEQDEMIPMVFMDDSDVESEEMEQSPVDTRGIRSYSDSDLHPTIKNNIDFAVISASSSAPKPVKMHKIDAMLPGNLFISPSFVHS